ncbi:class I SAM-dependent methyltransferase [Clostridium oceanicum]|uniref:Class I SAM-dependent methyltransferase n=1 Tax=Clostridium oceanicum TaxID=1543 RepID=A0ABP3ULZ4_9CLOT
MGTCWKNTDVSRKFNLYNDMLEEVLGFNYIFNELKSNKSFMKILDFGCGPGKVSERMAKIKPESQIIAVDQSENMLKIAMKEHNRENINYRLVEEDKLKSLEDNSIDCVVLCFVIINNSSKDRIKMIFEEIYRVLKKDGKLFILDSNPNAAGTEFSTFRNGEIGQTYSLGDNKKQYLKIPNNEMLVLEDYYWSRDFYINNIEKVGFKNYKVIEQTVDKIKKYDLYDIERLYDVKEWGNEKSVAPFIIFDVEK